MPWLRPPTIFSSCEQPGSTGSDESDESDDGSTFTVLAGLTERPRALALGADGAAIVGDDDGILVIGGDGNSARILDRPTDAVAVCGGVALALSDDGVYRWTPGTSPVRVSDRPPIRGVACGPPGEARWLASGLGVWTSPDGTTWIERVETLGRRIAGAATVGQRVWLAIDNGLVAFDPSSEEHALARLSARHLTGQPEALGDDSSRSRRATSCPPPSPGPRSPLSSASHAHPTVAAGKS